MASRTQEYINCTSEYGKLRGSQYPGSFNGRCTTSVQPRLAIKVNYLSTLFVVIFANGLGSRTDLAFWNAVSVVLYPQQTRLYVDVSKSTAKDGSCNNQCLLHVYIP